MARVGMLDPAPLYENEVRGTTSMARMAEAVFA